VLVAEKKILRTAKMTDRHPKRTPVSVATLESDPHGEACCENWDYALVFAMLIYLSSNSRPDIRFAVNQCARFMYAPRKKHEEAVKHIKKGIEFDPH
jgi:hypothetical protein